MESFFSTHSKLHFCNMSFGGSGQPATTISSAGDRDVSGVTRDTSEKGYSSQLGSSHIHVEDSAFFSHLKAQASFSVMPPSRQDLLDLVQETYGVRHPDFDSIREQYSRITDNVHDEDIESDARLLLAGLDATKNTYEDWDEMSEYEKRKSLDAIKRIRNLTRSTLKKYDVTVE